MKKILYIIIPCYNGEKYVKNCLNSVIKFVQINVHINITCVFIDDGSSDNTKKILDDFILNNEIKFLKYLYENNKGLSCARNLGLDYVRTLHATGVVYILFLDVDDILNPINIFINNEDAYTSYIYGYKAGARTYSLTKKHIPKLSAYNPFVVSCIIFKIDDENFDESLTALEDWDYWIIKFMEKKSINCFSRKCLTTINKINGSMSTDKKKMHLNRVKVSEKHLRRDALDKKHLDNFRVNKMFNDLSFINLVRSVKILFPYIHRRNFLSLLKNTVLKDLFIKY